MRFSCAARKTLRIGTAPIAESKSNRNVRSSRLAHLPAIVLIGALAAWFLLHTFYWGIDDSYITYRYAQNILSGNGPVFNSGERYLGTTAPGFALLLVVMNWLVAPLANLGSTATWLDIAHIARYLSALALLAIGLTLYAFLAGSFPGRLGRIAGAVLAVFVITRDQIALTVGHETLTCIALILLGFYLWREHRAVAALFFGLATLVRPDAGLAFVAAATIGLLEVVRSRYNARLLLRYVVSLWPFLLPVLTWGLFAWSFYGSPIPGTILAKRGEAYLGLWPVTSLKVVLEYVLGIPPRRAILLAIPPLLGLVVAAVRRDEITGIGLWGLLLLAFYSTLGISFWYWYATPLIVIFSLCGAFGVTWLLEHVAEYVMRVRPIPQKLLSIGFTLSEAFCWVAIAFMVSGAIREPLLRNPHISSFDQVITYLHVQSPNGTSIATPESGALAYYLGTQYRIIDVLGLASPGIAQHTMQGDLDWAYEAYRPEWILISYPALGPQDRGWLTANYREAATFTNPFWKSVFVETGGLTLRLFRRTQ